jgi:hypothetical protein
LTLFGCGDSRVRGKVFDQLRQRELRAFGHLLTPELFATAALKTGRRLGRSALALPNLVWLAVAAAWHKTKDFAALLSMTLKALDDAGVPRPAPAPARRRGRARRRQHDRRGRTRRRPHDPRGSDPTRVSEEAFCQARRRMPGDFWLWLFLLLGERFDREHGARVRWRRFRLLALDGTCVDLPGWQPLAEHFGTANNGKARGKPQARLVMLQLPLTRLPWRYELAPLAQGERTCAARLLRELRPDDLVLMDAGFWSFGLFCQVARAGAFFAIRLQPQARLQTLKRLGTKDRLVRWARPSGPRWRGGDWPEALTLRVIAYQVKGFRPSAVVTNVLDVADATRADWVRLAVATPEGAQRLDQGLYHLRWQVETTFCELKVVQGLEGGLRSRTPEGVAYEVAGHVLLYLLVRWLMVEAAQRDGRDPLELSFRHALEELTDLRQALVTAAEGRAQQVLLPRLLERVARHRVPYRPGRRSPRPKDRRRAAAAGQTKRPPGKTAHATGKPNRARKRIKHAA